MNLLSFHQVLIILRKAPICLTKIDTFGKTILEKKFFLPIRFVVKRYKLYQIDITFLVLYGTHFELRIQMDTTKGLN